MHASAERLVGLYTQDRQGPMVLFFAGIHGNEVGGVGALREVFAHLEAYKPSFRGSVIGILGNPPALAAGVRYVQKDLNRIFDRQHLQKIADLAPELLINEDRQALELVELLERVLNTGVPTRRIFVDLHETSAPGGGFSVIRDSEGSRELAARLHMPLVFGIDSTLHTTLMSYLGAKGLAGVSFEGGQIGSGEAMEVHRAAIWTLLAGMGCLHPKDIPDYRFQINRMIDAADGLPKAAQTIYRHATTEGDGFSMLAGFRNFQPIEKHQLLGSDNRGPILSPADALILMPKYQKQGEDGFFLVEPVDY